MPIKNIEDLSRFLKARDELNEKVYAICREEGYYCMESWEIEGDKLVVHFREGGDFHPATHFTRRFPLNKLFEPIAY